MSFDNDLTKHQKCVEATFERELDKVQELDDKREKFIQGLSDMIESILAEKVGSLEDLPSDPDTFIEDIREMILYMWEDYR